MYKCVSMKKQYKKGELVKIVLMTIAVVGMVLIVVALPGMGQVLTLFKPKNQNDRNKLRRVFKQLNKQKVINYYQKNGKDIIEITSKGEKKLVAYKFESLKLDTKKRWDGKWRVVMFDIPERQKQARNAIGRKLKEIGFIQLQKSVFIAPYECEAEIDFIGEYFSVRKYIKYMRVEHVEDEHKLKNHFAL